MVTFRDITQFTLTYSVVNIYVSDGTLRAYQISHTASKDPFTS